MIPFFAQRTPCLVGTEPVEGHRSGFLQPTGSHAILFAIAASGYLVALLVLSLLAPGLKKVELAA